MIAATGWNADDEVAKVRELLTATEAALGWFDNALKKQRDREGLQEWMQRCRALRAALIGDESVSIALLGESGAGKSSLINSLLGVDLLPHDSGAAVTSAITELRPCDDGYCIEAQLESQESLDERFASLCARLRAAIAEDEDGQPAVFDRTDESTFRALTGESPNDVLLACEDGCELSLLHEDVRSAIGRGSLQTIRFGVDELPAVREACRQFLSSRSHLWPIVQRLTVSGPFDSLSSSVGFTDVPGINDPDPVRGQIAASAFEDAKLVWLVLNAKRAVTGAVRSFLVESRLLTRLHMNGRLDSLVIIVTHADQLDDQSLIEAFQLPEDVALDVLVEKHAIHVEREVRGALLAVWDDDVQFAGEHVDVESAELGRQRIGSMPLFSVSSTESLILRHIVRARRGTVLETDEQTGVPKLLAWLQEGFLAQERRARTEHVVRQILRLRAEIKNTLGHRKEIKEKLAHLSRSRKGGVDGLQQKAHTFLEARIASRETQAESQLEGEEKKVLIAIDAGLSNADVELSRWANERLGAIHWRTLKAIARWGGTFRGSTADWDLPNDIATAICRKVVFRWSELFESVADRFLDDVVRSSEDLLASHTVVLHQMIESVAGDEAGGLRPLRYPMEQLEYRLQQQRVLLHEQLQETQLSFSHDLVNSLRVGLRPAFDRASQESGSGMAARMRELITRSLFGLSPKLFPGLGRDLGEKVAEVIASLRSQQRRAFDEVRRLATIEAANVENALFHDSPEDLLAEADLIANGLRRLAATSAPTLGVTSTV